MALETSMERKSVKKLRMPKPPHPGLMGLRTHSVLARLAAGASPSFSPLLARVSAQTRWMNSKNGDSSPTYEFIQPVANRSSQTDRHKQYGSSLVQHTSITLHIIYMRECRAFNHFNYSDKACRVHHTVILVPTRSLARQDTQRLL
jgi:hypothetical protein